MEQKITCLVSGATSYLGKKVCAELLSRNHQVVELGRSQSISGVPFAKWSLGTPLNFTLNFSPKVLIHCAWDMREVDPGKSRKINVDGSLLLFQEARKLGVEKIVFISSISAYEGSRSVYGQSKLAVEKWVLGNGGTAVRPGLIWGPGARGMINSLEKVAEKLPVFVTPGSGRSPLYLCHIDDLTQTIVRIAEKPETSDIAKGELITAAYPEPISFLNLLNTLAGPGKSKRLTFKIPWRLMYIGLKFLETLGLRPPFKSDSLVSLLFPNANPEFGLQTSGYRKFLIPGN